MSNKEILRLQLMTQVEEGKLSHKDAAKRLKITERHVRRLLTHYRKEGVNALTSKRRGKPSNNKIADDLMDEAMCIIGNHYRDFGPTLATEKLSEQHAIKLSVETVRKKMTQYGYWMPKRGQTIRTHPIRDRRPRRGELIQIDGSPHDWFEGRAPHCCLLVFIDDATSELMDLQFVDTETSLGYMGALERHIRQHGVPVALYSDRHSIFRHNPMKNLPTDAQTQFARALEQLGIEGIQANSPQAKGRVERANQTLQDRLVKEMRLQKLNDQASANQWLPTFIQDFNRRFAVSPRDTIDAHSRYEGDTHSLRGTLSLQTTRRLSKNLSCHFENELLQVKSDDFGLALRGAYVTVHRHVTGQLELRSDGKTLPFERMAKAVKQSKQVLCVDGKGVNARVEQGLRKRVTSMLAASPISRIDHLENRCAP